ncbi:AMP-binding protein [Halorubrum tibetense]|uniref:AMP-binding protein n=1 Tax=Halorubrum tibetense TaxID=175631 RepID=A0ABD5SAF3_9EURY
MDVVGDLLARSRRSRDVALVTAEGSERTYHDLITNAYKAANVLRYLGAREGSTIAIDPEPGVHTTLAFLGAARLGATVRFDPSTGIDAGDRVVVAPLDDEPALDPDPGTNLVVFGGSPDRPETTHWEAELWSENPGTPPSGVGPDDPVIRTGLSNTIDTVTHRSLLEAAGDMAAAHGIDTEARVVLRTSFADPEAVAAGIVAPLSRGGTVVLADRTATDGTPRGDVAVVADADADVPEPRRVVVSTADRF